MSESHQELMIRARRAQDHGFPPGFDRTARDLLGDQGPLLLILGMLLEYRDGLVESNVHVDLASDEGRFKAVKTQGLVQGVDTCLQLIHGISVAPAEEPQS